MIDDQGHALNLNLLEHSFQLGRKGRLRVNAADGRCNRDYLQNAGVMVRTDCP